MVDPTGAMKLREHILAHDPFPKENHVTTPEEQKEIKRWHTIMNESECYKTSKEVAHWIPAYFENSWTREVNLWTTDETVWTIVVNV